MGLCWAWNGEIEREMEMVRGWREREMRGGDGCVLERDGDKGYAWDVWD